jgi:hypothetical protein
LPIGRLSILSNEKTISRINHVEIKIFARY